MTLTPWKASPTYSVECPSIIMSGIFSWSEWGHAFGAGIAQMGCTFLCASYPGSRKSICLIIDINLGQVAKMVSAECSHRKVTIFPFVINKCLGEKYFETMLMSCFSSNSCLLALPSVVAACLLQWSLWCSDGDFPLLVLSAFVTRTPKTFCLTIRRTHILTL